MLKNKNISKLAWRWIGSKAENADTIGGFYCENRDVFQTGLVRMIDDFLKKEVLNEDRIYMLSAIVGEIGNNSFDHNLGNWSDVRGVFFGHEMSENGIRVVLADRGQGIFATLKRVKPKLKNDEMALKIAFTEKISGRAPENRGNGLKFVKEGVKNEKIRLDLFSGKAQAQLNDDFKVLDSGKNVAGCLAEISINLEQ